MGLVGKSHLQKCQSTLVCGKLHAGIGVGGFGMGDLLLVVWQWCCWSVVTLILDDALTADVKFCKLQLAVSCDLRGDWVRQSYQSVSARDENGWNKLKLLSLHFFMEMKSKLIR